MRMPPNPQSTLQISKHSSDRKFLGMYFPKDSRRRGQTAVTRSELFGGSEREIGPGRLFEVMVIKTSGVDTFLMMTG